jgi:hypothetical protein
MNANMHQPHDYALRWIIESSESKKSPYLVDLGAYNGVGCCQCRFWVCNVGPKVKAGQVVYCKHVRIARERFTNWSIEAFRNHDQNQKQYEQ